MIPWEEVTPELKRSTTRAASPACDCGPGKDAARELTEDHAIAVSRHDATLRNGSPEHHFPGLNSHVNEAIWQFCRFERSSLVYLGPRPHDSDAHKFGLWDRTVAEPPAHAL